MTLSLTARAESELRSLLARRQAAPGTGLRLGVRRGGCAGWEYVMQVAPAQPGDLLDGPDGLLIVAADSIDQLRGCQVDYSDDLSDAGFKISNPNAVRSCGCGTSFEPAAPSAASHS